MLPFVNTFLADSVPHLLRSLPIYLAFRQLLAPDTGTFDTPPVTMTRVLQHSRCANRTLVTITWPSTDAYISDVCFVVAACASVKTTAL